VIGAPKWRCRRVPRSAAASGSCARTTISYRAVANEIDVNVLVGRPMMLEIIEEGWPVRLEAMNLEIAQREREAVIDADQRRHVLGQSLYQPFCNPAPGPIFPGRRWRWYSDWQRVAFGLIDAQTLQARTRRPSLRVVDFDVSGKGGHVTPPS
jgi:hypothetical protein